MYRMVMLAHQVTSCTTSQLDPGSVPWTAMVNIKPSIPVGSEERLPRWFSVISNLNVGFIKQLNFLNMLCRDVK